MTSRFASTTLALLVALGAGTAVAKLPPPSDDAKAKAAEAAAKAAYAGKLGAFQLCQSMDRVAARYLAQAKADGKSITPTPMPPCADPGAFAAAGPAQSPAAPAPKK